MKLLLLCYLLIFSLTSFAQSNTEYVYEQHGIIQSRQCFEVDSRTKGREYREVVLFFHCKPAQTEWFFQTGLGLGEGTCFLVDSETGGDLFKVYAWQLGYPRKICRPLNYKYLYKMRFYGNSCFLVDAETQGENYSEYVSEYFCLPVPSNRHYVFERYRLNLNKKCYLVDKETRGEEFREVVENHNCKPEDFTRVFERHGLFGRKKCYNVDTETMGELYRDEIDIIFCRRLISGNIDVDDSPRNITNEEIQPTTITTSSKGSST